MSLELTCFKIIMEIVAISAQSGLDLNFQGQLSDQTSEIRSSPVLHEIVTCTLYYIYIIYLNIYLSCRTSAIVIQLVQGVIF